MALELLEKRLAPAGIVTITLSGGALIITGDAAANGIEVFELSEGTFRVTGTPGTDVKFGTDTGTVFDVTGVTKGLTLDLKDGDDSVTLGAMSTEGSVSIALGAGDNQLTHSGALFVQGDLTVTALKGNDSVTLAGSSIYVSGKTSFKLGDGEHIVSLQPTTLLNLEGGLFYTGGSGKDQLSLQTTTLQIGGPVDLKMGAGDSKVTFSTITTLIEGSVSLTTAAGKDGSADFTHTGGFFSIHGGLTIKNGAGEGNTSITVTDSLLIGGNVSITNGGDKNQTLLTSGELLGNDRATLEIGGNVSITNGNAAAQAGHRTGFNATGELRIGGSYTVSNGTGGHRTDLSSSTSVLVGGKVTVSNGDSGEGISSTTINGPVVKVMDSVTITNKVGLFNNRLTADSLQVVNAITMTNGGAGALAAAGQQTNNFIKAFAAMTVGAINITNGVTYASNTIEMGTPGGSDTAFATGIVSNGITIKNGNTPVPATVNGASTSGSGNTISVNSIEGSFNIGGNVAITNGNGNFINDVGRSVDFAQISIGGSLTISNGNGTLQNSLEAAELTVNKGVVIKNGNIVLGVLNAVAVGELNVNGAFSLTNGNSDVDLATTFQLGTARLGSLIIKNGNGRSAVNILAAAELNITGALSLTNGNVAENLNNSLSTDVVSIGSVAVKNGNAAVINTSWEFGSLTVAGALSITNGNATVPSGVLGGVTGTIVNSIEDGTFLSLGSLTIKNGNGTAFNSIESDTVAVQGAVNISSGTSAGGIMEHEIEGDTIRIGGPVTFTTKGGDTRNIIEAELVELGGSLTLSHGAGNDRVFLGLEDHDLFVNGSIVAKLGAGDTQVQIGDEGGMNLSITGSVSVTALAGNDLFFIGAAGRIGGSVTGSFGAGQTLFTGLISGFPLGDDLLQVGGAVSLTAGAETVVQAQLVGVSIGALTLTGGSGEDQLSLYASTVRGAVKMDLKAAADTVIIDDVTFLSSFTLLTGAGDDEVKIEGTDESALPGRTRFHSAVNIDMGAGEDLLELALATGSNGITFFSTASFNGGTDENTLLQGDAILVLGPRPVATGFDA